MDILNNILRGLLGVVSLLAICYFLSNNRKAISWRLVASGLGLQFILALFVLKTATGKYIFQSIGWFITKILDFSQQGAQFVFGPLADSSSLMKAFERPVIFAFGILMPTIIFVCVLVAILYHYGIMQRVVAVVAKGVYWAMGVSGSEALSNVASAFVGQVEAQVMVGPYVKGMTKSELLASMTGSMACISGGVMAIYISMGVPPEYLLAASIMAAPGALVIAKMLYPETEESETRGEVKLEVKSAYTNVIEAISSGCSDGLKISLNVIAMLIGFIALIGMIDWLLGLAGGTLNYIGLHQSITGYDLTKLCLKDILGTFFAGFAWLMGIASNECFTAGGFLGTKFVINEFVAYDGLAKVRDVLSPKTFLILSFALCGFANFSSIGIQIGGISQIAPERRADLSSLGMKALIAGTLASYLSATIAGMLM